MAANSEMNRAMAQAWLNAVAQQAKEEAQVEAQKKQPQQPQQVKVAPREETPKVATVPAPTKQAKRIYRINLVGVDDFYMYDTKKEMAAFIDGLAGMLCVASATAYDRGIEVQDGDIIVANTGEVIGDIEVYTSGGKYED